MNLITLPNDLNLDASASIQIFDYCSSQEIARQQIVLNQYVFSFLLEGVKEVVFDDAIQVIDPSSFLLMKAGHCLMTEKLSKHSTYRSVLFFFSKEDIQKFAQKIELNPPQVQEYQSIHSFAYDDFILRYVASLLDIDKLSTEAQHRLLAVKFDEIMWYLIEVYGMDLLYSLLHHNDSTQKFTRTIESNKLHKLTLKELAFLCNMSVSTFKRTFEKHYAESPMQWFQNKRLDYARYLLHFEKKTASEIYLEIGYENLSSFIQAYKIKFGVTPKQDQIK
ncbi:helix-turn-helix domain-containing protein [Myroides odoratus]|uniref:Transcriptional activator FtrA n=1 Tax=Myroides odoratus TaxID=256 RepID=A0A378U716_MYROD|nr:AraC family transcriptional regulator [Myroides odoratus]QQU02659.1 helix-turn-helix transcriptional regulator [Myroides odoratus]STZ70122.1 transcriptional activator FtrA [Myroides odoratus]